MSAGPSDRPAGPPASVATGPAPRPEPTWHRVHPVTPAVRGWKVLLVLLVFAGQQMTANVGAAQDTLDVFGWVPVVGAMALAVVVGFAYAGLAWRMTRYAVDREAVYLHTGVLFRQQRSARLDRIQAIDVVQPLLARLLGLAELKIEVAGGSDSAVRLAFLKEDAAQALRYELLARAGGAAEEDEEQRAPDAPAPVAGPEHEVIAVPPGRLVGSLLRSGVSVAALVAVAVVTVVALLPGGAGATFGMLPVLVGTVGYAWQRFAGEFAFRAALSPDGIRLRRGLLESRAQTVPPGRIQAVELVQPLLWRGRDWWRVQVNVAGYGITEGGSETVLLPVGDRDDALMVLWMVLPDLGTEDPRALLDVALTGSGTEGGFVTSPRRARWLDPLAWRRNGYALTDRALLARSGRLVRRLVVVPHERTQSLGLEQGPLQRRLDLASFALHSTPGPVTPEVPHLDAGTAAALLHEQARRARMARAGSHPVRWMLDLQAQARPRAQRAGTSAPAGEASSAGAPPGDVRDGHPVPPGGGAPPSPGATA